MSAQRLIYLGFILAFLLRAGRVISRWEEVSLAYSAYHAPVKEALFEPFRLISVFVGLHPPGYGVMASLIEVFYPAPILLLAFSGICSFLAVVFITKAVFLLKGPWAGAIASLLAGTAPVSLHYASELNNYPMVLALISASFWMWARYLKGGSWLPIALIGILAAWTHVLGGVVAGLIGLFLLFNNFKDGLKVLGLLALGSLPAVCGAINLLGDDNTFSQPDLLLGASLEDWKSRFGYFAVVSFILTIPGLRSKHGISIAGVNVSLFIVVSGMVLLGVAAPHQFPYWTLLMPGSVALIALGVCRIQLLSVILLALIQGYVQFNILIHDIKVIAEDQNHFRAIDTALLKAKPKDCIWLVSPALQPDDDKRAISPVLWRLSPFVKQHQIKPFPFDYTDYRFGQPRSYKGISIFTFTDFWPARMDMILEYFLENGGDIYIVLYDHGPADSYPERLKKVLRPWVFSEQKVGSDYYGLGVDWLFVVTGENK